MSGVDWQRATGGAAWGLALVLAQSEGKSLLDQAGEAELLACCQGFGFGQEIGVEIERRTHARLIADFCILIGP